MRFRLKFWQREKQENRLALQFKTVEYQDLENETNLIKKIKDGEIHGLLIKNVLTSDQINGLINGIKNVDLEEQYKINSGLTIFPEAFSLIDQLSQHNAEKAGTFFANATKFWERSESNFGFNFPEYLYRIISAINGGHKVQPVDGYQKNTFCTPATFKIISNQNGELKAHCGNYFYNEFDFFYGHLEKHSMVKNQLSYFFTLQKPLAGGELIVYNLKWDDVKIRLKYDTALKDKNGKIYDLLDEDQVERVIINPEPGDLVLFSGGQIWHKVDFVQGSVDRITLGGFLSVDRRNEKDLFIWS